MGAQGQVVFEHPAAEGRGINLASMRGSGGLAAVGYEEEELFVAGAARSYRALGPLTDDGRWSVEPAEAAPFRSRIVVRRPADPGRDSGTVVVEWLNVSAGVDAGPDWSFLETELVRRGHTWVGVSAQAVGVVGGDALVALGASNGLRGIDDARYGTLEHPGDAHCYDLFASVGRALRDGPTGAGAIDPLGGRRPTCLLAIGESQSAFRLTGYLNAVHPIEPVFDGFLVHSRVGPAADLGPHTRLTSGTLPFARIRDDLDVPVIIVETETDLGPVLDYLPARQPDAERIRLWEIAGTAHADATMLGGMADLFGCSHLVNDGPQGFVVRAALAHLERWVRGGATPPHAPRLSAFIGPAGPALVRDGHGNALGGIRTPLVDVPVATLTGEPPACDNTLCFLFGSTTPFAPEVLGLLYPSVEAYTDAFTQATDDAIAAGFVLPDDRDALLAAGADAWARATG